MNNQLPIELIASILVAVGALISLLGGLLSLKMLRRKKKGTTEDRIRRLTNSLREATQLISNIESEITSRYTLAEKLQKDVDVYNKLVELRKPEVEAVAQLLRGELEREGRRSFWKGFATNFLFFVLGAIASGIMAIIVK
jgi:hypothetical protein